MEQEALAGVLAGEGSHSFLPAFSGNCSSSAATSVSKVFLLEGSFASTYVSSLSSLDEGRGVCGDCAGR